MSARHALDLDEAFDRARAEVRVRGVLLDADAALPSLTALLAGEAVRGSWWAHPLAHEIYGVGRRLAADPDVLLAKLINQKRTYIDRSLWPSVFSIATSGEAWQIEGLTTAALALFDEVRRVGALTPAPDGDSLAMLESRLLVVGIEEHTARGRHGKRLESWAHWASRAAFSPTAVAAIDARREIERVVGKLPADRNTSRQLPWQGAKAKTRNPGRG